MPAVIKPTCHSAVRVRILDTTDLVADCSVHLVGDLGELLGLLFHLAHHERLIQVAVVALVVCCHIDVDDVSSLQVANVPLLLAASVSEALGQLTRGLCIQMLDRPHDAARLVLP
jgi:hypothetical protein